jgi:AcrR family transcriptional regulator
MNGERRYSSKLRQRQSEATRARILEAALGTLTPSATELPFEKVAARVPVSVRTVYRYFPTQRDLLAAVGVELEKRTGWHAEKVTAENMGALTRGLFVYLDKNFGEDEPASPSAMDLAKQQWRGRRISTVERVTGPLTEDMDPRYGTGRDVGFLRPHAAPVPGRDATTLGARRRAVRTRHRVGLRRGRAAPPSGTTHDRAARPCQLGVAAARRMDPGLPHRGVAP